MTEIRETICNKCKKIIETSFYNDNVIFYITEIKYLFPQTETGHLCNKCKEDFKKWLNTKKTI